MTSPRDSRGFVLTSSAALGAFLALYVLPPPRLLEGNIDAGWCAALVEQFLRRAQMGVDLVFTYGPWGILGEPVGNPAIYPWLVFGRLVLALGTALGAAYLAVTRIRRGEWRWLWLGSFVVLASPAVVAPFLLYAVYFEPNRAPQRRWSLAALAPACALAAHVKLIMLPLVAALAVLIFFHEIVSERRIPWISSGLAVCYAAFYFAAGQHAASFVPYLRGAFHIVSSYGYGMALDGPASEVALGALLCAAMPAIYIATMRRMQTGGGISGALWVAAYFFTGFKQAFVRQDGGHLGAGILSWAVPASMVLVLLLQGSLGPLWPRLSMIFLALEAGFFIFSTAQSEDPYYFLQLKKDAIRGLPKAFQGGAARLQAYRAGLALLGEAYPLPPIPGAVDVLPHDVSILLAHSMDYRPRPVIQSYQALDPYLAGLNAGFLAGPRAPEFVLINADALDNRYPSTEDNLAWLSLLTNYQPAGFANEYLVLRKSVEPAPARFEKIVERSVAWDEPVEVPAGGQGAIWAAIDVGIAPLGHLIDFVLRPPEVDLNVQAAGVSDSYRLVIPLARSGFLLSPLVVDAGSFAGLYPGGHAPGREVSRMALTTDAEGLWCYRPRIAVRLYRLTIGGSDR